MARQDWIRASWVVMANQGVEAVKVEVLARHLGVSKGSFYWHFQNRAELLDVLLQVWQDETDWLIRASQQAATPEARLSRLLDLTHEILNGASEIPTTLFSDGAVFLWARTDPHVADVVRSVEQARITYVTEQLLAQGFAPAAATRRAEMAYLAFLGYIDRHSRYQSDRLSFQDFKDDLLAMLLNPMS